MTRVVALQGFHYQDAVGVAYAGIGEEFDLPDHLVADYVSIGRVRAVESAPATSAPDPTASVPPASAAPHPLDHDGDGKPGGSLPAEQRGLEALWAEAEALGISVDRRRTGERARRQLLKVIEDARAAR